MSDGRAIDGAEELVAVALVVRTRGLRGELVAEILTGFPERFADTKTLIAVFPSKAREKVLIENFWFQKDRVILKFEEYDSVEAAEKFIGCELAVPESETVELDEDEFYDWELEGCAVETVRGEVIGRVRSVWHAGGVPLLVIDGAGEAEHLVPLAEKICVEINVDRKLIRIDPPEGLLEL
ncbi:MAG: 16S rRNA processing protein RimM [Pyrinomonadaceae bacterium]|jgi:16S rRNA processing protein RimM|nr:16S rRNA processing protein RimM [Pyrinomonadaceae bacterium]